MKGLGKGNEGRKFTEVGKGVRELWEVKRYEMRVGFSLGNFDIVPTMKVAKNTTELLKTTIL